MHNLKVLHTLIWPLTITYKTCKCSLLHRSEGKETEGQRCAAVNMYKDLMYHHSPKFSDQHQKKPTVQKTVKVQAFSPSLFLHLLEKSTQDGDPSFFYDILFACL